MAAEVGRMFINAQRAADAIVASAQRTAQSLLDDARRQADIGAAPVVAEGGDIALAVRSRVETEALSRALDEVEEKLRRSQARMLDRIAALGEPEAVGPSSSTLSLLPLPSEAAGTRPDPSIEPAAESAALMAAPVMEPMAEPSTSIGEQLDVREALRADVAPAGLEAAVDAASTSDASRPLVDEAFRRPGLDLDPPAPAPSGTEAPWAWSPPAWPAPGGAGHDVAASEPGEGLLEESNGQVDGRIVEPGESVEAITDAPSPAEPASGLAHYANWAPPSATPVEHSDDAVTVEAAQAPAEEAMQAQPVELEHAAPVEPKPEPAAPAPAAASDASVWAVPPALAGPVVEAPAVPAPVTAPSADTPGVAPPPAWDSQALSPWAPSSPNGAGEVWAPPVGAPLVTPVTGPAAPDDGSRDAPTLSLVPDTGDAALAPGPAHAKAKRQNPPWLTNVMWAFAVILITAVLLALINLG